MKSRKEKLYKIADHYGYDRQCKQLLEEMAELAVEICKIWRKNGDKDLGKINYKDMPREVSNAIVLFLANEMADVRIMLDQIEYLLGIGKVIDALIEQKLNRQIKRIKEERHSE